MRLNYEKVLLNALRPVQLNFFLIFRKEFNVSGVAGWYRVSSVRLVR